MSDTALPFLPYGRQTIEDDDVAAVAAALRADFLTTGPTVEAFETAFKTKVGAEHAIAVANGTATLHLAMLALGVGQENGGRATSASPPRSPSWPPPTAPATSGPRWCSPMLTPTAA